MWGGHRDLDLNTALSLCILPLILSAFQAMSLSKRYGPFVKDMGTLSEMSHGKGL